MRAEIEESAKRKERIQDLYNNAPCGYHSLDENGFFVDINDTELQWLGYERGEVIGKIKLTDIATPSSIAIFKDISRSLIKAGFLNDLRLELITKSGAMLPVIVNAKSMYDSKNNFRYSLSTFLIEQK